MTASCCGRGVSQHVTQVYSADQVDQLKAAISCILCGSPGALRNFAQHSRVKFILILYYVPHNTPYKKHAKS